MSKARKYVISTAEQQQRVSELVAMLPLEAEHWEVHIKPYKHRRTSAQNRYYWGVLINAIREHVYETQGVVAAPETVHEHLTEIFLPFQVQTFEGKDRVIRTSTTKLNVAEFNDYIEKVTAYCVSHWGMMPP